jgi:hypothetical protein
MDVFLVFFNLFMLIYCLTYADIGADRVIFRDYQSSHLIRY